MSPTPTPNLNSAPTPNPAPNPDPNTKQNSFIGPLNKEDFYRSEN